VIVAAAGAGWVFAIDAVTFAVSAGFPAALRVSPGAVAGRQTFFADLATAGGRSAPGAGFGRA
jgi:hypothetical protein